jgi:hypothetical protein
MAWPQDMDGQMARKMLGAREKQFEYGIYGLQLWWTMQGTINEKRNNIPRHT